MPVLANDEQGSEQQERQKSDRPRDGPRANQLGWGASLPLALLRGFVSSGPGLRYMLR